MNLHPSLALKVWDFLEQKKPNAIFVYATHSLSFAMRLSVTDLVILGEPQQAPIHLVSPFDWPRDQLSPFLGAIPAVITARRVLLAEGRHERSFDGAFYRWILGRDVEIANAGSCENVRAAVKHEGIWQKAGDVRICGVVDRDYKPVSQIKAIEDAGCLVLPYHEAESYLCIPSVLLAAASRCGRDLEEREVVEKLVDLCRARLVPVARSRALARTKTLKRF